jgi:hypothetical protein
LPQPAAHRETDIEIRTAAPTIQNGLAATVEDKGLLGSAIVRLAVVPAQ